MINWFKDLFNPPIWKEANREFIRREKQYDSVCSCFDEFDVYVITYKDLKSDRTKIEEQYILR